MGSLGATEKRGALPQGLAPLPPRTPGGPGFLSWGSQGARPAAPGRPAPCGARSSSSLPLALRSGSLLEGAPAPLRLQDLEPVFYEDGEEHRGRPVVLGTGGFGTVELVRAAHCSLSFLRAGQPGLGRAMGPPRILGVQPVHGRGLAALGLSKHRRRLRGGLGGGLGASRLAEAGFPPLLPPPGLRPLLPGTRCVLKD